MKIYKKLNQVLIEKSRATNACFLEMLIINSDERNA